MASSTPVTVLLRVLAAILLAAGLAIPGVAPAAAHTALISADPPADATLTAGPSRVTATFNEDLQTVFAAMTVVGPDGNLWSEGEPQLHGAVASVAVRPLGHAGTYTVNYRVTSSDGHVVSGSWSFAVTTNGTGTPGPPAADAASANRIPLWPFGVGSAVLVAAAAAWSLRRRS